MTVSSVPRIQINGAIDTSQTVLSNINAIATNSQSWVTWDTTIAKWRIIANAPAATNTAYTFDDTTIIGGISVTGTPLEKMYNAAEITFNNDELRDDIDSLGIRLPEDQRYPNESENAVNLNYTLINNPIHAQLLGSIELLQSRLDKIITFTTDFSSSGLTAGEVIRVNAPIYGYSNKLFRVTTIEESDEDDGGILFRITAIEYNSSVYSSTLQRDQRTKATDIIPFELNNCVQQSINEDLQERVGAGNCWCFLFSANLGVLDITADTNNLYTKTNQEFFEIPVYEIITPGEPPVLSGYATNDFDVNDPQYRYDTGYVYTAPKAGWYRFYGTIYYSLNVSGADLMPQKNRYKSALEIILNGTRYNGLAELEGKVYIESGNGTTNSYYNTVKHENEILVQLDPGETVEFVVRAKTDYGPSRPEVNDSFLVAWSAGIIAYYSQDLMINMDAFN